jgi:vacuolar-type H+-ATPase subunit E/Vma4
MGINLDKLVEEIMKENRTKAEEIRKEALVQIEDTVSRARAEAIREADQIARSTKTECGAAVNKRASQEKQKARLIYLTEKNEVLDGIMKEVETKLVEFCRDDSRYRPFLVKSIARGMAAVPSERIKIALSHADLRRYKGSKLLEDALATMKTTKTAVLDDEPIETIGGAVVTSHDDKVRVDCTLEAKRELMKMQLLAEMSRILFVP